MELCLFLKRQKPEIKREQIRTKIKYTILYCAKPTKIGCIHPTQISVSRSWVQ